MPNLTHPIPYGGTLHDKVLTRLRARHTLSSKKFTDLHEKWRKAEESFIAYLPERAADAERRKLHDQGGLPQYRTIVMPYTYAMVMAAHSYAYTTFLGRDPVFQYMGRHGETEQQVMVVEAMVDYNLRQGAMLPALCVWLLDCMKYGIGVIHTFWDSEEIRVTQRTKVPQLVPGTDMESGRTTTQIFQEIVGGYQGNRLQNVQPYHFFPDPRVPLMRFQDGEFCGVRLSLGWNIIWQRGKEQVYTNVDVLRKKARRQEHDGDYRESTGQAIMPAIGAAPDMDDVGSFELLTYVVEIIPEEWGVGPGSYPEKYVFTWDAQNGVIVQAAPYGSYHNRFPWEIVELEPNGYTLHSRGIPEIIQPIQNTIDWLINSRFYNVRAALNNQLVVDPSRVELTDLADPMPGGVIRTTPLAMGQDIRQFFVQLDIKDLTRTHLNDIEFMHVFAQRALGINEQILGMPQQGGRRSASEARANANFGVNRQRTTTEMMSAQGFTPLSQQLIVNIQQYYTGEMKLRIVGDLAVEGMKAIQADPTSLAGMFDFVPVDGTLPVDRFAQANLWREILAGVPRLPMDIQQGYQWDRIFAWTAQLAGLKNIHQFKVQLMPDAMLQAQAQAGNVVPMPQGPVDFGQVPEPGMLSGMGRTG